MENDEAKVKVQENLKEISKLSEDEILEKYSEVMQSELYHDISRTIDPKWVCDVKDCKVCNDAKL